MSLNQKYIKLILRTLIHKLILKYTIPFNIKYIFIYTLYINTKIIKTPKINNFFTIKKINKFFFYIKLI